VYFFVAAALMTMLGYGWVNTEAAIPVVSASSHST
jgi:hypothetical protein